jgi:hypothetical protein
MTVANPHAEEDFTPVLREPRAMAEAFGLDEATVMDLVPQDPLSEGPLELHERWVEVLGLPGYSVGMGFRQVQAGESDVEGSRFERGGRGGPSRPPWSRGGRGRAAHAQPDNPLRITPSSASRCSGSSLRQGM